MDARHRPAPTGRSLAGALASAFLLIMSLPPFGWFPLGFLALVPLVVSISYQPSDEVGRRSAAKLGMCFGLVFWGWSLIWVPLVVGSRFAWAFPGYLLQLTLLGCLFALFAWVAHGLHKGARLPLGLAVPLAWVGLEWVKAHFPLGLAFPWLGLGVTLSEVPRVMGIAEWVGETGVAFWVAAVNGLVAAALRGGPGRPRMSRWLLVSWVAFLPAAVGVARARYLPLAEGPRILVVGTEVSPLIRGDPGRAAEVSLRQIQEALSQAPPGPWDLVLLPEGAIPFPLDTPEWEGGVAPLRATAEDLDAPLAFGTLGRSGRGVSDGLTNSAVLLSPGDQGVQRYDKVRLVPGMEAGALVAGQGIQLFSVGGRAYGPLVCYESLYAGLARRARNQGAVALLNLTSDVWFGRSESMMGSLFLSQHPAHLILRAVETRTPVARSANGGYSLLLDPLGEVISSGGQGGVGIAWGRLPVFDGTTLFSRTGDWLGPCCMVISLLLLFLPRPLDSARRSQPC